MEAKFNINCPLSLDEANEIQNTLNYTVILISTLLLIWV